MVTICNRLVSLKTELKDEIASAITESENSIKSWINDELLEGYYKAAVVDEKINALNTVLEASKSTAKTRIDSLATELTKTKAAVDTAKANIRTEYKNAIDVAINKLDGEIREALLDSIAAVNARIEALDTRVTTLEGKVLALEGKVDKLLAMIQSVSIVPAYSDGSVEAVNGILTLKCIVSPAEAIIGMESLKDSLLIYADSVKVKTKATTPAYMTIKVSEASVLDAAQGAITLKADISKYLPKGEDKALTVAVNIRNGISDFTTKFVPVSVADPDIPDLTGQRGNLNGHEYVIIKCGDKNLKWATMNIGATTVTGTTSYGDYFMWGAVEKAYTSLSGTTFTFGSKPSSYTNSSWDASKGFAWDNCNFTDGKYTASGQNVFTKYTADIGKYAKSGTADGKTDLEAVDDAAAQIWGSTWRIPTGGDTGEFKALYDATKWTWDATDKGYYVTKKDETLSADKSNALLFFPAAGYGYNTTFYSGDYGYYWSSSIYSNTPSNGHCLKITSDSAKPAANYLRFNGSSVRPVSD